jgi:hypothetical protein
MAPTRNQLLAAAKAFCDDFASKEDVETVLSHFSATHQCSVIEHGERSLTLPFLGQKFVGLPAIRKYYELIGELLNYANMRFSEFIVDVECSKVAVKGRATFTWIATGETWDETFAYALDFDDELMVTDQQVWADSGAAYLASTGKLREVRKVSEHRGQLLAFLRLKKSTLSFQNLT